MAGYRRLKETPEFPSVFALFSEEDKLPQNNTKSEK
jgi:hypothetical protein